MERRGQRGPPPPGRPFSLLSPFRYRGRGQGRCPALGGAFADPDVPAEPGLCRLRLHTGAAPAIRHLHPASGQPLLPVRVQRGLPHARVRGLDVRSLMGDSPGLSGVCWGQRSLGRRPRCQGRHAGGCGRGRAFTSMCWGRRSPGRRPRCRGGALEAVGEAEPSHPPTPSMSAPRCLCDLPGELLFALQRPLLL